MGESRRKTLYDYVQLLLVHTQMETEAICGHGNSYLGLKGSKIPIPKRTCVIYLILYERSIVQPESVLIMLINDRILNSLGKQIEWPTNSSYMDQSLA